MTVPCIATQIPQRRLVDELGWGPYGITSAIDDGDGCFAGLCAHGDCPWLRCRGTATASTGDGGDRRNAVVLRSYGAGVASAVPLGIAEAHPRAQTPEKLAQDIERLA